jgi:hypothetical protein
MTGGAAGVNICATAQIQGISSLPDARKRGNKSVESRGISSQYPKTGIGTSIAYLLLSQ